MAAGWCAGGPYTDLTRPPSQRVFNEIDRMQGCDTGRGDRAAVTDATASAYLGPMTSKVISLKTARLARNTGGLQALLNGPLVECFELVQPDSWGLTRNFSPVECLT
jgi:hypothetical protein